MYHKYFFPKSRTRVITIRQDMIAVPDDIFSKASNNQVGYFINFSVKLYLGGIIEYRMDTPCIEVFHEQQKGLEKLAKELGFAKFIKDRNN